MLTTTPKTVDQGPAGEGGADVADDRAEHQAESPAESRADARARRPGLPGWLRIGLVALLVAAAAVGAVLVVQHREHAAEQRAADAALAAARTAAVAVLSYDYRHLDDDFATATAVTTEPFTGEYERTTQKVVRPVAVKNKAVVSATVSAAGVVSARADRVVVLAFVNQTTRSSRLERPQVDQTRVELTMLRQADGRWLVGGVKAM